MRLLTRGLTGSASGLITVGLGPAALEVVRIIRGGRSAAHRLARDFEERFKIGAMLIQANGKELIKPIFNTVTKQFRTQSLVKVAAVAKSATYRQPKKPTITVSTVSVRNKKNGRN